MVIKQGIRDLFRKLGLGIRRIPSRGPYGLEYMEDIKRIFKDTARPRLILDVGANEGQSAVKFSKAFPEASIHAFEPSRPAFQKLVENTKSISNITPANLALGSENTNKLCYINEDSKMNSLLKCTFGNGKEVGEESVCVVTLDYYISRNNIFTIDLLKIDTQGYDLEVLKGSSQTLEGNLIHLIYIEINFVELYRNQAFFEDIYLFLLKYGFKLTGLYAPVYSGCNYIQWCDALFVNPSFASKFTERKNITN